MSRVGDASFLKTLDNERCKNYRARILVLDKLDKPIRSIEGRVQQGSSISINGSSSMRRTCNLSLVAEEAENDLTNIENFLSINKKIKIMIGMERYIDYSTDVLYYDKKSLFPDIGQPCRIYVDRNTMTYWKWNNQKYEKLNSIYDYEKDLIWFPLGVYVICQPNLSHTASGCIINLSCKDKMCLLNGEMGGTLPGSLTLHEYDQFIGLQDYEKDNPNYKDVQLNNYTVYKFPDGTYHTWDKQYGWTTQQDASLVGHRVSIPELVYDIIYTIVINYGGESASRMIISDVPTEVKQFIRYTGKAPLYHNVDNGQYTTDESYLTESGNWVTYEYSEDIGYTYTDFTYNFLGSGTLITNLGDTVTSVLDKIVSALGNYEYFYDIDGNFVFQEIKNYLNTSYINSEYDSDTREYYLEKNSKGHEDIENNNLQIIGQDNYQSDHSADQKSIYTFEEGNNLITSYSNAPNYSNLKNDYHIWGKNGDGYEIHYHLVIKEKPKKTYITYRKRDGGKEPRPISQKYYETYQPRNVVFLFGEDGLLNGRIRLLTEAEETIDAVITDGKVCPDYIPEDWRAELYIQGLEVTKGGGRPDIYQQELLDHFDSIYEFGYYPKNPDGSIGDFVYEGRFKEDVYKNNMVKYFIDYLEPTNKLYGITVDDINTKIYTYQQDNIAKLYDNDVPNFIILDPDMDDEYLTDIMLKCDNAGQPHSLVEHSLYQKFSIGTIGYSAQETVRDLLYQYTNYRESITFQCIPVYSLDVNRRITVRDKKSGINGDYIINSITMPLSPSNTMNITASRALNRL